MLDYTTDDVPRWVLINEPMPIGVGLNNWLGFNLGENT